MPGADPRVILAILGTGVFSIIGAALWLWRYKKSAGESAVRDRESLQLRSDQERNAEANENYLQEVKKIPDDVPDAVDPGDPWAGVR